MILILFGKACVGKDTVLQKLVSIYGFTKLIADATPSKYACDDYNIIDVDTFCKRKHIATCTHSDGYSTWYTGYPEDCDYASLSKDYVVVLDPVNAAELVQKLPEGSCYCAYLYASPSTRKKRSSLTEQEWAKREREDTEFFSRDQVTWLSDLMIYAEPSATEVADNVFNTYKRLIEHNLQQKGQINEVS